MERLTFVDEDGRILFDNPAGLPEDVGFTIRELAKNEEWEALDNIAQRLANCEQRLKCYKDLEEQKKLLKPPVAPGNMTYRIHKTFGITDAIVERIEIDRDGSWVITSAGVYSFDDFGKTVFLTQSAAEAALKEMSE